MALDATVAGTASNSLVTVAYADAYFASRPTADDWTAVGVETVKESALIYGTDYLDLFDYKGYKYSSLQALAHPRQGMHNREGTEHVDESTIVEDIKKALCELALHLVTNAESFESADNVTKVKLGPIAVEFDLKTFGEYSSLPMNVQRLIDPYIGTSGHRTGGMVRS